MAVGFDAVGPSGGGGFDSLSPAASGTVTWTHTCGASATALIVAFQTDSSSTGTPTVTAKYNSVSMTALGNANVGGIGYCFLFGLLNPTTGSALTVSITYSIAPTVATIVGGSASFTGAGGFGSFVNGGTTNKNITITSTTSGNMSIGVFNAGASITGEPTTNRWLNVVQGSNGDDLGNQAASTVASSTGSTSIASWTTASTTFLSVGVEVQVPAGSTASPKPIVVTSKRKRVGGVTYRKTPPVFTAPTQKPLVRTFVRRNRGSRLIVQELPITQPPPASTPSPIVRTIRRRNRGVVVVTRQLAIAYPPGPPIVHSFVRRNRGSRQVTVQLPQAYPPGPPIVHTTTRRNRGSVHLLTFPPVFVSPPQAPIVRQIHRRNRGVVHLQTFPPPLTVPTQAPVVRSFHRRNRGSVLLFTFPPVFTAPTQRPIVHTTTRRNRGVSHLLTLSQQQGVATPKPIICTFRRRNRGQTRILHQLPVFTPATQRPIVRTRALHRRGVITLPPVQPPPAFTIGQLTPTDQAFATLSVLDSAEVIQGTMSYGGGSYGSGMYGVGFFDYTVSMSITVFDGPLATLTVEDSAEFPAGVGYGSGNYGAGQYGTGEPIDLGPISSTMTSTDAPLGTVTETDGI